QAMDHPDGAGEDDVLPAQQAEKDRAGDDRAEDEPEPRRTATGGEQAVAPHGISRGLVEDRHVEIDEGRLAKLARAGLIPRCHVGNYNAGGPFGIVKGDVAPVGTWLS